MKKIIKILFTGLIMMLSVSGIKAQSSKRVEAAPVAKEDRAVDSMNDSENVIQPNSTVVLNNINSKPKLIKGSFRSLDNTVPTMVHKADMSNFQMTEEQIQIMESNQNIKDN